MTRGDIIRLAREAGWNGIYSKPLMSIRMQEENFLRFAALVAAEKDKEIERLQDMLYELLGELTALRAEKQMRGYIKQLKDSAATSEREKVAEENAELLQALQNLHQRCHWADAPEEMDAAKAAIEKAIRARGEQLREALKTYGQHRNNCAAVLGGYQCTCGFNQQEQTR
jgi:hypothetical protein